MIQNVKIGSKNDVLSERFRFLCENYVIPVMLHSREKYVVPAPFGKFYVSCAGKDLRIITQVPVLLFLPRSPEAMIDISVQQ